MIIRELFVKIGLIDNSSDRLKDVQKEADRASQNFQKLGVNGQTSLDMMGRAVGLTSNEMEKLISKTKTDLKLEKDFKDAARAAGMTEEEISRVKNSIDRAKESAASWKGVMAGLASLGIGAMAGSVISNGVKMAAQAEDTAIQFEVLQGSAEKAKNTIEALQKFSANTPFESDQVLKAGRQLLAVKFSSEELIPTLKMIGDVSKGTGKDFNELATIFAKNKSSNFIQGEDLNQLIEAGIPILDQFGKMFGKTALQVKEMGSKNQIEFKHLKQAFQNMTKDGGDYSRMMERLSKTSIGMFSTAVDGFKTWSKMIGNFVLDIAKPFLQFFTDAERGNMRLYTALTILAVLLGSVLVSATMAWAASLDAVTMASIRTYAALIGPAVILAAKILAVYLILEDIWTFFEYGPRQSETYFADLLKWMGLTKYDLLVLWDTMDDLKVMFLEAWENISEALKDPSVKYALIAIGIGLALLLAPMAVLSLALFALKTVLVVGIVLGIAYIAAKWN
ncbi:MAG TPA: tape measure protein, partial [Leptospiraceae bacterium]|nr:tape measure protein [Leptospiraceae bacterium]